jgi:bifunctional ADP-heptose synthase (sugar kinase/adenylyltransferase)
MDSGSGSESDDSSEGGIDDMTPEEIDAEIAFLQAEETSTALKKGAREAIIVINGCFCPVHAGHLRSLEETKRLVEASGEFRCVAGYFAVAPDKAVKKKVVGKLKPWMTQAARVEMCSAVPPEVTTHTRARARTHARQALARSDSL